MIDEQPEDFADDPPPPKVGRPTKYEPGFVQKAAEACYQGATLYEVAEMLGVSRTTLNLWRATYPEFSTALRVNSDHATDRVEASLHERAVGYSHPDVHISAYEGEVTVTPIVKHYPPDYQSASLWLRNKRAAQWRDKQEVEHSASDDLLDVMKAARERAGLTPPKS